MPYKYPSEKHERAPNSLEYEHYRKYKKSLKEEFQGRCVYCCKPDQSLHPPDHFGVDHYRPQKYFPELTTDWENLYYCCNSCNSRKGAWPRTRDWPDEEREPFIPNPCEHVMSEHLQFAGLEVQAHTPSGALTAAMLSLNHEHAIAHRQYVRDIIASLRRDISDTWTAKNELEQALDDAPPSETTGIRAELAGTEEDLARVEGHLRMLTAACDP